MKLQVLGNRARDRCCSRSMGEAWAPVRSTEKRLVQEGAHDRTTALRRVC